MRNGDATPRIGKRCPRSPSRRHSSSQGHEQSKSDCRLRRRLVSVVKEYQGIREELGCGQSARHKMLMTVAERTMQQVMLLEARKSKRRKHNKKSTRKRRTASSSASCTGSGGTSDTESEDLGLESSSGVMEISKQYTGGAPQVISPNHWKPSGVDGRHPRCTGRSTTTGIGARFGHKVFGQDYNEEILRSIHQCRDESIGRGNGLIDGWPCGTRGRHRGPEVPSPRIRCHRRGDSGAKQSTWNWPLWTVLRL